MAPSAKKTQSSGATRLVSKRKGTSLNTPRLSKRAKSTALDAETGVKTGFLSLPAELRNKIYEMSLTAHQLVRIRSRYHGQFGPTSIHFMLEPDEASKWREPALLRVCKVIRAEAVKMYYGINDFDVTLTLTEFESLTRWLKSVIIQCGRNPFGHLNLYVVQPRWAELEHIRSFVHLFQQTGLELKYKSVEASKLHYPQWMWPYIPWHRGSRPGEIPAYHFLHCGSSGLEEAMQDAIELGTKAWKEHWHEDWLDVEFGLLVEEKLTTGQGAKMHKSLKARRRLKKRTKAMKES